MTMPPRPAAEDARDALALDAAARRLLRLAEALRGCPADPRVDLVRLVNRTLAPCPEGGDRLEPAGR